MTIEFERSGNLIMDAARFAPEAHKGQRRKYTNEPYIVHPTRVANRVMVHKGSTPEMVAAAFLHDVYEDTAVSWEEVYALFGQNVHSMVWWLTNGPYPEGANRELRKWLDRNKLKDAPWQVKIIKMYDRIDNLNDLHEADMDFKVIYYLESLKLADAIGDADTVLKEELISRAKALVFTSA